MSKAKATGIKIVSASYHRNGVCGVPFWAVLFDDREHGRMVASIFGSEEKGYCAVYKVDELAAGNIDFAQGNSWRGDHYESTLRKLIGT